MITAIQAKALTGQYQSRGVLGIIEKLIQDSASNGHNQCRWSIDACDKKEILAVLRGLGYTVTTRKEHSDSRLSDDVFYEIYITW